MKPEKIKRNFKDIHFLKLAIRHGHRSIGMTWPNPPVGCIIVKDNKIIGRGSTGENGIPHAEIKALKEAGEFSKNSDLYCSLEPCSHHGKTPPCVDEIIKNKISRVIIPFLDPNPLVKGNGIKVLKEAGIKVVILKELEQKAYELIKGFNYFIQKKRPFITLKIATSLDGMISTKHGTSKWISNSFSRERVQYLRYINDAILVGTNTAKKDKPSLKIRNGLKIYKQPKRCFIDTKLSLEPKDLNSSPDYIFYSSKLSPQKKLKWDDYKTTLIQIKNKNDHLDVVDIVKKFYELKFHYVLIAI